VQGDCLFWAIALGLCVSDITMASGREIRGQAGDTLAVGDDGCWGRVQIEGHDLGGAVGSPVVSVCDVGGGGTEYVPLSGAARAEAGALEMSLGSGVLGIRADLAIAPSGAAFKFSLRVEDTTGKDRGLLVRVGIPLDAVGWTWWHDIGRRSEIGSGGRYEDAKPLRGFAALPEWKDKPDLRLGFHTANFCTVVSGPCGICLAIPLDQPRIFRTAYDARQRLLTITYDLALCKDTMPPSRATCEFELFGCDPGWGMRSALDIYYRRHEQFFAKNLKEEGMWVAFTHLDWIDNPTEFGIGIQEGAGSVGYDDKIGAKSLSYYTHAGMYADVPNHRRGVDPTPSLERRIAAVEAAFRRSTGRDGVYGECGLHDATGALSAEPGTVYGDVLAQFCLEPEMFYGRWLLDRIEKFFADFRTRGELDGFYYDGLTTGINYRREHFRHAAYPPSWDPIAKKPYLYNYFSSVEWARLVAEKLHALGKITMMNGAIGASPFCAPFLDVMGAETGLVIPRGDFNFVKSLCHHKTFVTLLKGNYAKMTGGDVELFMRRCLAFGVFPGYFDWPPSGLGPGGTYWDHPEYYERDRALFRKYVPLVKAIARAGWEPLTLARATNPELQVERFGSGEGVFFAVLNDSSAPVTDSLRFDGEKLGLPEEIVVFEETAGRKMAPAKEGGTLVVPMKLDGQGVALFHIATEEGFVRHHRGAATEILNLADIQRRADEGRPAMPCHWRASGRGGCSSSEGGLLLQSETGTANLSASQWVMLFQSEARPITIRARTKTLDVGGKLGETFGLQATVCSVDKQFTSRERRVRRLEPGTGDWRDIEWTIVPERPVRSIELTLRLGGRRGSAWFDDVSVRSADAADRECVVDGGFESWYERLTPEQWARMAPAVDALRAAVADDARPPARWLTDAHRALRDASEMISEGHLENSARRVRRDLDEVWDHMGRCGQVLAGIEGVELLAPETVAAGEEAVVGAKVLAPEGLVRRVALSIRSERGWKISGGGQDASYRIFVPADAKAGTVCVLRGEVAADLVAGGCLPLAAARSITVVSPFDAELVPAGVSEADGSHAFRLRVTNRLSRPQRFAFVISAPPGWAASEVGKEQTVAPRTTFEVPIVIVPGKVTRAGRHSLGVEVRGEGGARSLRRELDHLPAAANLLRNGDFEVGDGGGLERWSRWEGGYAVDAGVARSGRRSLRLQSGPSGGNAGAHQSIELHGAPPAPLIVRGWCKTENLGGQRQGCCLYVDIYYVDGTKLYGQRVTFDDGTHDWQYGEARIETTKPIRALSVYAMLRGAVGTAWFDEVFVGRMGDEG